MSLRALDGNTLVTIPDLPYFGCIWPVGEPVNITQGFANNHNGFLHRGVDIGKTSGTPVRNAARGRPATVAAVNTIHSDYGNHVLLYHGRHMDTSGAPREVATLYAHFLTATVVVGQEVVEGEVIGFVDNTGYSTGNHLHWEVRVDFLKTDGAALVRVPEVENPLPYMDAETQERYTELLPQLEEVAKLARLEVAGGNRVPNLLALGAAAQYGGFTVAEDTPGPNDPEDRGIRRLGQLMIAAQLTVEEINALPSPKLDTLKKHMLDLQEMSMDG